MLWPCWHVMLVFLELLNNLPWHQDVKLVGIVIPLQFYATVEVTVPIFGEFVVRFQALD